MKRIYENLEDNLGISIENLHFSPYSNTPNKSVSLCVSYFNYLYLDLKVKNYKTEEIIEIKNILMAKVPVPTPDGEFIWVPPSGSILKANRYVLIKQLKKMPGLYYTEFERGPYFYRYCDIKPVHGMGIRFREVISDKGNKINKTKALLLTDNLNDKYQTIEQLWDKIDSSFCFSVAGKRQLYWSSNNSIPSLDINTPSLSFQELSEIYQLFDTRSLEITDDRSLATRKVQIYDDYLQQLIQRGMRHLEKTIKDKWSCIPVRERDDLENIIDRLVPDKPLQSIFDSFFSNNALFQLLDTTNPLAELSQKRRVTFGGPGGYPDKALLLEKRDVHSTDFGRLCPVETPQGENLGFSLYLAKDAKIDEFGFLCAKYINKESQQAEWLNVYDEITSEAVVGDCVPDSNDKVQARTYLGDELTIRDVVDITHFMPTSHSHLGYAASLIPFFQHNDANRALMGANMMKQSLSLLHKQIPFVTTGLEADVAKYYSQESPFKIDSQLFLGVNLLTGYLPWDFYTYEDAVVVSDSLLRNDRLTHVETEEIYFDELDTRDQKENITCDSEFLDEHLREWMEVGGSPPVGVDNLTCTSNFAVDDIFDARALVEKFKDDHDQLTQQFSEIVWEKMNTVGSEGSLPPSKRLLNSASTSIEQLKEVLADGLNALLRMELIEGLDQVSELSLGKEIQAFVKKRPTGRERIRLNRMLLESIYPDHFATTIQNFTEDFDGVIREGASIVPGSIIVSKLRLVGNEESGDNFAAEIVKILVGKIFKSEESILSHVEDASLYAADGIFGKVTKVEWVDGTKGKRRLKIVIESQRGVRVGDKIAGRHGNKGVISRIVPEREMPYFYSSEKNCTDKSCCIEEAHTHLELLMNPLTITSRMNLGQLYETSASWLAETQGDGTLIVPPFDSQWSWEKISECLEENNIPVKRRLFYQEKGEEIPIGGSGQNKGVTVGYQYILKLKHLADDKNKARNQSALNPATGQPITPAISSKNDIAAVWENRKARKHSAQRLGEMEVWALLGHGAIHLLDELLFLKSDSNHLKQHMINAIHKSNRVRKKAFNEFKVVAEKNEWGIKQHRDYLVIITDNHEGLSTEAGRHGLKVQNLEDNTFKLTYSPLEVFQRSHQAFKTFVIYCRSLGLEVEGSDRSGHFFKLVDTDKQYLPKLSSVRIRIANDNERSDWAGRKIKNPRGDAKLGLWPDEWDDADGRDESAKKISDEKCDFIQLPTPIDNPLFRAVLQTLLSVNGCRVDREFMVAFQALLIEKIGRFETFSEGDWQEFWVEEMANRSRLLMREDVLAWLRVLVGADVTDEDLHEWLKKSGIKFNYDFRKALPTKLSSKSPYAIFPSSIVNHPIPPTKEKDTLASYRSSKFQVQDLFQHFRFLDLEVLKERLKALPEKKKELAKTKNLIALIDVLLKSEYKPTDFFLQRLCVLPRNLRHEHQSPRRRSSRSSLSRYAYNNDLNYIYQKILFAIEKIQNAADIPIIQADLEERLLRPLVHALLSNRVKVMTPVKRPGGRPLRGIIDILAGGTTSKDGFFRRHLLGKSVDFSGRAVIIPDPELGIDETSIPLSMGLTLFRDMLIQKCMEDRQLNPSFYTIVDEDTHQEKQRLIPNAVRLVRAKKYIRNTENLDQIKDWLHDIAEIHPLVLNRAPSLHRLSLLSFYTRFHDDDSGALNSDACIHLNPFVCSPFNADFDGDTMAVHVPFTSSAIQDAKNMLPSVVLRSPGNGRLFIDHKKDHALASFYIKKNSGSDLYRCFDEAARKSPENLKTETQAHLSESRDQLKKCGFSFSIDDFLIDKAGTHALVNEALNCFELKDLQGERSVEDYWSNEANKIGEQIIKNLPNDSPFKILYAAEAGKADLNQLSGIRGIMERPGGRTVPWPILSNIAAGMTSLEYFVSCHGSRNGLADKGLLTAPAGDITNTMVQATQGFTIVSDDCGCDSGLMFKVEGKLDRFVGRFAASTVEIKDGIFINAGEEITNEYAEKIGVALDHIKLRSPVTCNAPGGVCQKCYGRELSGGDLPVIGYPVGIIAAQSIGEPGTQLTLSSFHSGGTAGVEDKFGIMDVRDEFINLNNEVACAFREGGYTEAAEKQIARLQVMYHGHGIVDHHFEVIIRTMFYLDNKRIRSVLDAATEGDGFLSRLAFKDVPHALLTAVLGKEQDSLSDIKSKIMTGQIL